MNAVVSQPATAIALPDFLQAHATLAAQGGAKVNDDFMSGLSAGISVPRLSIEGKVFRTVVDGEERPLTKFDAESGQEVPITSLPVVIVRSNRGKMKMYYGGKKYDRNATESSPPVCFSYDGEVPSVHADTPQCTSCAACPHNVWGSLITESGNKSRACSDGKMLAILPYSAVAAQADPDDPEGFAFALKLSPTALSRNKEDRTREPANNVSYQEFVQLCSNFPTQNGPQEIPVQAVVARLFFDINAEYPLLRFKPAKFLSKAEYDYVLERANGEDVQRIVTDMRGGVAAPARIAPPVQQPTLAAPQQAPQIAPVVQQAVQAPVAPAVVQTQPVAPIPAAAAPVQQPVPAFGDMGADDLAPQPARRGPGRPKKAAAGGVPAVGAPPVQLAASLPGGAIQSVAVPQTQAAQPAPAAIDDALAAVGAMFG